MIDAAQPKSKRETFRLRSFVRRDSRLTNAQERAHKAVWPKFGLQVKDGWIDLEKVFARTALTFFEIGFGSGQSLLELAKLYPERNYIGVETHKPGVGALCLGVEVDGVTNLRLYDEDVVDVLAKCIPDTSLDGIQIFFPDPWQKRRHHARRLIQSPFIKVIVSKLKMGGELHLATDWDDYAKHMMRVVSLESQLENLAGINQFATRSPNRPIETKFERRAIKEGRKVCELQLRKISIESSHQVK